MIRKTLNRRSFCRQGLAALSGLAGVHGRELFAAEVGVPASQFRIESIDRTTLRLPYREIPRRAMDRELPHWRYTEVFEVALNSGSVGIGETLLYYIANNGSVNFMLNPGMKGKLPYFQRGVNSRLLPDDGSAAWRQLYEKAQRAPYFKK